jgi:hypothetical protein
VIWVVLQSKKAVRARRGRFKELAPCRVGGVFSWFNGAFEKLYTDKRVVEDQYFWRSIARS